MQSLRPSSLPPSFGLFAVLVAGLSIIGPFSIDTALPAFPSIEQGLGASSFAVQQTLTAYIASYSVMILWHGAISDAVGRRRPILWSLAIFALASLGCASSRTIGELIACRVLQGLSSGAGAVIGRAMIRDAYSGPKAEKLFALVATFFSVGPALAPIIGGVLVTHLSWRAIFVFLFGYSVFLILLVYRFLPETLACDLRLPRNFLRPLLRSYRSVLSSPRFFAYAGAVSMNFAGLFVYISAAPVFVIHHLGLSAEEFYLLFLPMMAGTFCGGLTVVRIAARLSIGRQVGLGYLMMFFASFFELAYHSFFLPKLPYSVAPLFLYGFGMSLVAPGVTLLAMDLFPNFRGVAASCQSAVMTMVSAIVAGFVVPLLSASTVALAVGELTCVVLGFLCWQARLLSPVQLPSAPITQID